MGDIMDIQTFSQNVNTIAKSDEKKASGPMGREISEMAHEKNTDKTQESMFVSVKNQQRAAILQSAIDMNISAGNEPMSLVLRTALDGINEALKETMGDNAIQTAYDSGIDVSPEATAERIVSLSTAFFDQYQEQHPEMDQDEALVAFTEVISGGIDKGFAEAREILNGLKVLEGEIASNIDKTYDLVQDGLKSFVENFDIV